MGGLWQKKALAETKAWGCNCVFVESCWNSKWSPSLTHKPVVPKQLSEFATLGLRTPQLWAPPEQDTYNRTKAARGRKIFCFCFQKKVEPLFVFASAFPYQQETITRDNSFVIISHRTKTMLCLASQAGGVVPLLLKQSYRLSFWPLSLGHPTGIPGDNFFLKICYLVFCYFILWEIAQKLDFESRGVSLWSGKGSAQAAWVLSFKSAR